MIHLQFKSVFTLAACFALALPVFAQSAPLLTEATALPVATVSPNQDGLTATAWVQNAAEAKIAARQAYRLATRQLDAALRDKNWSGALEQALPAKRLPPAVILDLDETVLDNSAYQARLMRDDAAYSDATWKAWVAQSNAPALPGAVGFLAAAQRLGVQIFYISNRTASEETATRENLRRLGCPLQGPDDHVLLQGEKPEWTSDKTSRRRFVAQTHRVLLLVGDDLNDFVPSKPLTLQQRVDLFIKYDAFWGERWILLSNPLYGSWESAIYNYKNGLSRDETLRLKQSTLQLREPEPLAAPTKP